MLTTDEYEHGGAAALRELVEAGASPSRVRDLLDALDAPDEDESKAVVAEHGRVLTLAQEGGNLPIPGDHSGLSAEERLIEMVRPKVGLSTGAERLLSESLGSGHMIGGLPLPSDTITLEELRSRLVIGTSAPSTRFSGEMAGGMAVPD